MQTRRQFVQSTSALGAGVLLTESTLATAQTHDVPLTQVGNSCRNTSLINEVEDLS